MSVTGAGGAPRSFVPQPIATSATAKIGETEEAKATGEAQKAEGTQATISAQATPLRKDEYTGKVDIKYRDPSAKATTAEKEAPPPTAEAKAKQAEAKSAEKGALNTLLGLTKDGGKAETKGGGLKAESTVVGKSGHRLEVKIDGKHDGKHVEGKLDAKVEVGAQKFKNEGFKGKAVLYEKEKTATLIDKPLVKGEAAGSTNLGGGVKLDARAEGQVGLKVTAGAKVEVTKDGVEAKVSTEASLAKAKASTTLSKEFEVSGQKVKVEVSLTGDAEVVARARASGEIKLEGSPPKPVLAIGGEAFAGARAGLELKAAVKWQHGGKEVELANIKGTVEGRAGAGAGIDFDLGFHEGKLKFEARGSAVLGVGAKAGAKGEVNVAHAAEFAVAAGKDAAKNAPTNISNAVKKDVNETIKDIKQNPISGSARAFLKYNPVTAAPYRLLKSIWP